MRRVLLPLLAALAAAASAAPASAKELTRVSVCGQGDRCTTISDPQQLKQVPLGGATSVGAPPPEPFYVMTITFELGDESEAGSVYYLPKSKLIAANAELSGQMVWLPIAKQESTKLLRHAVAGIEAHPAPKAWPRELKSTYRVIPDDVTRPSEAPAPQPDATTAADRGAGDRGFAVLVYAAIAVVAAGLASVVYFRRRTPRVLAH